MAENKPATSEFSSLIRIRCRSHDELPALPSGTASATATPSPTRPSLETFITQALEDGHAFITSYVPRKFTVKRKAQAAPPSTGKVDVSVQDLKASSLPSTLRTGNQSDEAWFARTSEHVNAADPGTASWAEFDHGLRVDHSEHERDYTPTVQDAHEVCNWHAELEATLQHRVAGWEDVQMSIREMRHQVPAPLNDRVFTVVVVTAKRAAELLVVQVPLLGKGLPEAKYQNASGVCAGRYVSVEHCEVIEDGAKIRWRMATASDAAGVLPMFIQKLALPGAVVKDVGWFIDWCGKNRKQ